MSRTRPPDLDLEDLPLDQEVGESDTWTFPDQVDGESDDGELTFSGTFLGWGTSEHRDHRFHQNGAEFAEQTDRCGACRWFETRIFRLDDGTGYLLYNVGASVVPGERNRVTVQRARSADQVIELYTRRRDDRVYLTNPTAQALAMAAGFDEGIREAYRDRAVQ